MSMTAEITKKVSTDPILAPNSQRFVLFPIKYHQVWEMYKKHEVSPSASLHGSCSSMRLRCSPSTFLLFCACHSQSPAAQYVDVSVVFAFEIQWTAQPQAQPSRLIIQCIAQPHQAASCFFPFQFLLVSAPH